MATYFISDLHLNPEAPAITAGFKAFIANTLIEADTLYILGDFFDAWIGDDEDHPYYVDIVSELSALKDRKITVLFMHGNRDFLIGEQFAKDSGTSLLPDPSLIEVNGLKVLLMHGDSLCTDDTEYMAFRTQVRNPAWQGQILSLPLEQRRAMAAQLRAQSKSMNSNKAEDIMDVSEDEVTRVIQAHGVNILLHGHTHRPAKHQHDGFERIVLGDWGKQGWYVSVNDKNLELHSFNI